MYAIVQDAGRQFRAEKGIEVDLDHREVKVGEPVEFDRILLVADGENVVVGSPTVAGAKVIAECTAHVQGDKIRVFKKRRRWGWKRARGARARQVRVRITDIVAG